MATEGGHQARVLRRPPAVSSGFGSRYGAFVMYRFTAPLWRYNGESAWYFITLPFDIADDIDERSAAAKRGFGSVRVQVTIGDSVWNTSVFPDTKAKSFVLPVKKAVRTAQQLVPGADVDVELALVDE
jgi:hypothetical protein